ncbi:unnamed protein product [Calicophoron daubneyi]|uniref:EF-hand domain-containing protein n=1 Tax=Calicophoron daubneyi TaxID=300641 RepID=A0AAV2TXJ6_CALDB
MHEQTDSVGQSSQTHVSKPDSDNGVPSWPKIELSAEFKEDIRKAFLLFDRNGEGTVDVDAVRVAFRALGFDTEVNEFKLLRQETKDSQGRVDFGEFLSLLSDRMLALDSEMDIGKSFELLDTGNKGYIDINDLRLAAEKLEMPEMYDDDFAAMLLGAQINDPAQELQRFYEERQKQARIRAGKTYGIDATADEMEGHPLPQDIMMSGMPGFQRARRLSSSGQPAPESLTVNLDQFKVLMTMTRPPIEDIKLL